MTVQWGGGGEERGHLSYLWEAQGDSPMGGWEGEERGHLSYLWDAQGDSSMGGRGVKKEDN